MMVQLRLIEILKHWYTFENKHLELELYGAFK